MYQSPADLVIQKFGSVAAVARALDIRESTVSSWRLRSGRIPSAKQISILRAAAKNNIHLTPADLVLGAENA